MDYNITLTQSELSTILFSINESILRISDNIEYLESQNQILKLSPGTNSKLIAYYSQRLESIGSMSEKLRNL